MGNISKKQQPDQRADNSDEVNKVSNKNKKR